MTARDAAVTAFEEQSIPAELRVLPQWVGWRLVERGGPKPTKEPLSPHTGALAATNDPSTWGTFESALECRGATGVGFVFTAEDRYVGIDLDACRHPETGELTAEAGSIVERLDSYAEISPSGTGVHILVRGSLPPGRRRLGGVEMYEDGRYFTMTGERLPGTPADIHERTSELAALHGDVFGEPEERQAAPRTLHADLSDDDLIDRARSAANGAKFSSLWSGNIDAHDSHSEADLALCSIIAYWAGSDQSRVDRLFRRSGLMRPKWDQRRGEQTYGEITVLRAIEGLPATRADQRRVESPLKDSFPRTDAGNAEAFAALHDGAVRFDHRLTRWLLWGEHRWVRDRVNQVRLLARQVARERLRAAADIDDEQQRKAAIKHANGSESRYGLDAMLELAKSEPRVADTGEDWDSQPLLLGVANGVVDLDTGVLRPGSPDDRMTFASPIPYRPDATCARFERFLREVFCDDLELVDFIQRAVGYSLTGITSEHALFLLHGIGRNGKSVLLNTLYDLGGDYSLNLPFSTFESIGRSQLTPDLALLPGKRLVTSSETNDGTYLNEGRIKALTGGDRITANPKYVTPFEFQPVAKFWLAVNHLPVARDDSEGFWRRVKLIRFPRVFTEEECDRHLEETLRAELPGILAWAVRGALLWKQQGLNAPDSVRIATETYRTDSDPLADFTSACCVLDAGCSIGADALYRAYADYTEGVGMSQRERLSKTRFGRRMGERFEHKRTKKGKFYHGIGLPSDRKGDGLSPGDGFDGKSQELPYESPREEKFLQNPTQPVTEAQPVTSPTCDDGCGAIVEEPGELCDECVAQLMGGQ